MTDPFFKPRVIHLSLSIFLIFTTHQTFAQIEHIEFKSDFEQQVFNNLEEASPIQLLISISTSGSELLESDIRKRISAFQSILSDKHFSKKSEEKQLKILFKLTHKNFFLKYQEIAYFEEIFTSKTYNCLSATALYCLILEDNNIPYSIKETPTHVYTIAYPNSKSIVLESTAPQNGYFSPSENDIRKAVRSLVELKYFTEEEVSTKGELEIYKEFFFGTDEINLKQLAGLQYYNEAYSFLVLNQYKEGLNSAYKSKALYNSKKIDFLCIALLNEILDKSDFLDLEDIKYLAQYAVLSPKSAKNVISSFSSFLYKNLIKESKVSLADSAYQYLTNQLPDSSNLNQKISEIYFGSLAEYYSAKSEYNKALSNATIAFALNQNDVNLQALITHNLAKELGNSLGNSGTPTTLDQYAEQFPFLSENGVFQSMYFYHYSYNAFNYLRADDIKTGQKYLRLMNTLFDKFGKELMYDEYQYGMVYAEICAAYYREKQYVSAKKIAEKGLEKFPDHPELKIRLEIVMDELD